MNYLEYNDILNKLESCTPSECITKMYEMTDEAGVLRIPVWPYDNDVDPVKRYFHAEMAWSREDAEALVREFQTLVNALAEMALLWKNEELGFSEEENRGILSDVFPWWFRTSVCANGFQCRARQVRLRQHYPIDA